MIRIFTDYEAVGSTIIRNDKAVRDGLESLIKGKDSFEIANLQFKMEKSVGTFEVFESQKQVAVIWIQAS